MWDLSLPRGFGEGFLRQVTKDLTLRDEDDWNQEWGGKGCPKGKSRQRSRGECGVDGRVGVGGWRMALERQRVKGLGCQGEGSGLYPLCQLRRAQPPRLEQIHVHFVCCIYGVETRDTGFCL